MTEATQTFEFEATAELTCTLVTSGDGRDDPKVTDIEDAHVTSIFMFGTEFDREALIEKFGSYGAEALMQMVVDAAPTCQWEAE